MRRTFIFSSIASAFGSTGLIFLIVSIMIINGSIDPETDTFRGPIAIDIMYILGWVFSIFGMLMCTYFGLKIFLRIDEVTEIKSLAYFCSISTVLFGLGYIGMISSIIASIKCRVATEVTLDEDDDDDIVRKVEQNE